MIQGSILLTNIFKRALNCPNEKKLYTNIYFFIRWAGWQPKGFISMNPLSLGKFSEFTELLKLLFTWFFICSCFNLYEFKIQILQTKDPQRFATSTDWFRRNNEARLSVGLFVHRNRKAALPFAKSRRGISSFLQIVRTSKTFGDVKKSP